MKNFLIGFALAALLAAPASAGEYVPVRARVQGHSQDVAAIAVIGYAAGGRELVLGRMRLP